MAEKFTTDQQMDSRVCLCCNKTPEPGHAYCSHCLSEFMDGVYDDDYEVVLGRASNPYDIPF